MKCTSCGLQYELEPGEIPPKRGKAMCQPCWHAAHHRKGAHLVEEAPEERRERLHHRHEVHEARTMHRGWAVVGSLAVICAVLVFMVIRRNSEAKAEAQAIVEASESFVAELGKLDTEVESDAKKILQRIEEVAGQAWTPSARDTITDRMDRASSTVTRSASRRAVEEALAEVDAAFATSGTGTDIEQLSLLRRKLTALNGRAHEAGAETTAKLDAARDRIEQGAAQILTSRARAEVAAGNTAEAFTLFEQAAEELTELAERADKASNTAIVAACATHLAALLDESDALARATFTPEVIAATAPRNLLDASDAANWKVAKGREFRFEITGDEMLLAQDANAKDGMLSFLPGEPWHDLVMEFDATVEKGSATLLFRVQDRADRKNCPFFVLGGEPGVKTTPGTPIHIEVELIGTTLTIRTQPDGAELKANVRDKGRKGAFTLLVARGTEMKLSRLRVRILR